MVTHPNIIKSITQRIQNTQASSEISFMITLGTLEDFGGNVGPHPKY